MKSVRCFALALSSIVCAALLAPAVRAQETITPQRPTGVLTRPSDNVLRQMVMTPEETALVERLGLPSLGKMPPAAGSNPLIAVVTDDDVVRHFRCSNGERGGDSVTLFTAGGHFILRFLCAGASFDGPAARTVGRGAVSVVLRRGEALAPGSGPVRLLPTDPLTLPPRSRTFSEINRCLNEFQQYKSDHGRASFDIHVLAGYPRCTTTASIPLTATITTPMIFTAPVSFVIPPEGLRLGKAIERIGAYRRSADPNGEPLFSMDGTLWRNDHSTPVSLALVTVGHPGFSEVRIVAWGRALGTPGGRPASVIARPIGEYVAKLESSAADREQVRQLGLQGVSRAWISLATLPLDKIDAWRASAPGQSYALRLTPLLRSGSRTISGESSGEMALSFGLSPSQQASNQVVQQIAISEARRRAQAKAEAEVARLAAEQFKGKHPTEFAPLLVKLAGWEPPFGTGHGDTPFLTTVVNGKADFTLDEAMGDLVWPNRAGWSAGCAFEPYYFVQAAQHKAKPNTVLEWILFTFNAWSAIYQMLQNFVVESFAYITTGGECPFNDPTVKNTSDDACGKYKSALGTGVKVGLQALGAPTELPSTNDLANLGAEYIASQALSYAGASEAAGFIPDEWKQKLTKPLADKIRKVAFGSTCAQPLKPGDDPKKNGYDGVDGVTLCGFKNGSAWNFARRNTWALGHPRHAVAWVHVTPNPNAIAADRMMRIRVDVKFTGRATAPPPKSIANALADGALRPFASAQDAVIDAAFVPPRGMLVPIVLPFDESAWKFVVRKANVACAQNAFEPQCALDTALNAWRSMLQSHQVQIDVNEEFRWTDDEKKLNACVAFVPIPPNKTPDADTFSAKVESVCARGSGTIRATRSTLYVDRPGHIIEGLTEGMPVIKACPGFKLSPPHPDTGMQPGWVVPDFDMNKL